MATPAQRWVDAWFEAWTTHDPAALAPAYGEGLVQRSRAFREPIEPVDYAEWAFADETAVEVWFAEPFVDTSDAAACEWWAISTHREGGVATLAGVSLIAIGPDGRVVDQRDHWTVQPGAHRPPEDWGPVRRHGSLEARG